MLTWPFQTRWPPSTPPGVVSLTVEMRQPPLNVTPSAWADSGAVMPSMATAAARMNFFTISPIAAGGSARVGNELMTAPGALRTVAEPAQHGLYVTTVTFGYKYGDRPGPLRGRGGRVPYEGAVRPP